jgi:hypothetical protein
MYVFMCVCMYVWKYVCIHVCMYNIWLAGVQFFVANVLPQCSVRNRGKHLMSIHMIYPHINQYIHAYMVGYVNPSIHYNTNLCIDSHMHVGVWHLYWGYIQSCLGLDRGTWGIYAIHIMWVHKIRRCMFEMHVLILIRYKWIWIDTTLLSFWRCLVMLLFVIISLYFRLPLIVKISLLCWWAINPMSSMSTHPDGKYLPRYVQFDKVMTRHHKKRNTCEWTILDLRSIMCIA